MDLLCKTLCGNFRLRKKQEEIVMEQTELNKEFHNALYQDNLNRVIDLIAVGADINHKSKDDVNALHIAAFRGNVKILNWLLNSGADINSFMTNGATPLFVACKYNQIAASIFLLENNADTGKSTNNGYAPIDAAILNKNIEITKQLIEHGANFYTENLMGALEFFSYQGSENRQYILNKHFEKLEVRNSLLPKCDRTKHNLDSEIVIIRFKEEIQWVPLEFPCHKVTVYNKGPQDLPASAFYNITNTQNLGFYDGSILKHIVDHYYNLAEVTVFLQAYPYDGYLLIPIDNYITKTKSTCNNIIGKCQFANLLTESLSLQKSDFANGLYKNFNYQNNNLTAYAYHYLDTDIPESFPMIWNSQFSVSREIIYRHSQAYYQNLLDSIYYTQYPFEAFYFERLWDIIFAEPTTNKVGECPNIY